MCVVFKICSAWCACVRMADCNCQRQSLCAGVRACWLVPFDKSNTNSLFWSRDIKSRASGYWRMPWRTFRQFWPSCQVMKIPRPSTAQKSKWPITVSMSLAYDGRAAPVLHGWYTFRRIRCLVLTSAKGLLSVSLKYNR